MQQEETTWKIFSSPYREEKGKKRRERIHTKFYSRYNIWLDFPLKLTFIQKEENIFAVLFVCSVNVAKKCKMTHF